MTTLYVAREDGLLVARQHGSWQAELWLRGTAPTCVAVDPLNPEMVYCGTFKKGLHYSPNGGKIWLPIDEGIPHEAVMSVAVSELERVGTVGVLYVGTEPSAVLRSEDGGASWEELEGLTALPSAPTWSFPPRPHTHHVRHIALDPTDTDRLYICVEYGALVRSFDRGRSWQDRTPASPLDAHAIVTHPLAPGRLYVVSGEGSLHPGRGYAESRDGGDSWQFPSEGLRHHYLWSIAVHPADPDIILVSAAPSPAQAHSPRHDPQAAESYLYRRVGEAPWELLSEGLPDPHGTKISSLAASRTETGVFYAANNHGIYRSDNMGQNWTRLDMRWPPSYLNQHVMALAVDC